MGSSVHLQATVVTGSEVVCQVEPWDSLLYQDVHIDVLCGCEVKEKKDKTNTSKHWNWTVSPIMYLLIYGGLMGHTNRKRRFLSYFSNGYLFLYEYNFLKLKKKSLKI